MQSQFASFIQEGQFDFATSYNKAMMMIEKEKWDKIIANFEDLEVAEEYKALLMM
jgi:hypothetical protein